MVTKKAKYILTILLLAITTPAAADHHGSVRIYKLNSKDQLVKARWVKNADEEGCHDLRGTKNAYRFAQVGFAWCIVYSGDKCEKGTERSAIWRGDKYRVADIDITQPQTRLLRGSDWYLDGSRNVEIGSWACEY